MTNEEFTAQKRIAATELGARDAAEGREPLWYRVGESYVCAETGHIGNPEIGAAYVSAYRAVVP